MKEEPELDSSNTGFVPAEKMIMNNKMTTVESKLHLVSSTFLIDLFSKGLIRFWIDPFAKRVMEG
ncbi:hypothetical protein HYY73_05170 [Candidatus Woesearchaeota archaeon]|nr:hypothetical protein [Candidatus Woesearchaeota archaeon]